MRNVNQTKIASSNQFFFENLDGLRFLAFMMVFLSHTLKASLDNIQYFNGTIFSKIIQLFISGGRGVSIFFVLSGFLITYLILLEINLTKKVNVGFFYLRRILRIWPLYYVVIIIALVLYPLIRSILNKPAISPSYPFFYYIFLSNFDVIHSSKSTNASVSALEGITWSVAVEGQFYLLWPILFFVVPKKFYKFIFLGLIAISFCFRVIHHNNPAILYYHSLSVCSDLAIGGMCAYLAVYSERFVQIFNKLKKVEILTIYIIGMMYLIFESSIFRGGYFSAFSRVISGIFFAFIILEQNYCKYSIFKFSKNNFFSFWGRYTYGLYLLHPLCLFIIEVIFKHFNIRTDTNFLFALIFSVLGLAFSLFLSYLSYEYYEKKFLVLKKRFDGIKAYMRTQASS